MKPLFRLARLQFLSASVGLYIFGVFWAILLGAPLDLLRMLFGYLIIFPGHLSVSFSNDYFDVDVDRFGKPAVFSGGSGVLLRYPELHKGARRTAITLIACSLVVAVCYQAVYSPPWWFLAYVALCNMLGWFYAAPPLRLSYRGLGEFSTSFTSGILVPGLGYLIMRGYLNADGLVFAIPLLLNGLGYIMAVEIPDVEADRQGGKRTWVSRIGRRKGYIAIAAAFLAASGYFFAFPWVHPGAIPINARLLGLFSLLPLGASIIGVAKRPVEQPAAARLVNGIVISLAIFFIFMDSYFIVLALR